MGARAVQVGPGGGGGGRFLEALELAFEGNRRRVVCMVRAQEVSGGA